MQNIKEMLEESNLLEQYEQGVFVVLTEAVDEDDAEGIVQAEDVDGGSRLMILKQITDLDFVPNKEWTTMCMNSETWEKAKGRDSLLWNTAFGNKGDN
jgi:hypothetical protein